MDKSEYPEPSFAEDDTIQSNTVDESGVDEAQRLEFRNQIEELVLQVVPAEVGNVDAMMEQFYGREQELIKTLRTMASQVRGGGGSPAGGGGDDPSGGSYDDGSFRSHSGSGSPYDDDDGYSDEYGDGDYDDGDYDDGDYDDDYFEDEGGSYGS